VDAVVAGGAVGIGAAVWLLGYFLKKAIPKEHLPTAVMVTAVLANQVWGLIVGQPALDELWAGLLSGGGAAWWYDNLKAKTGVKAV